MLPTNKLQEYPKIAFALAFAFLLIGCESPTSTQNLDPGRFSVGTTVSYFSSTGEGVVSIAIEYDEFLSADRDIDLGKGDAIVISSGEHSTVITSAPNGFAKEPIMVDPSDTLKMQFTRGGDVLQSHEMTIDNRLFPNIEVDTIALNAMVQSVNALISYGIQTPYEVDLLSGHAFGYGALLARCTNDETMVELELGSFLMDRHRGLESRIALDESVLNQNVDASFLVFREIENLNSGIYQSCETNLYAYLNLQSNSEFVTYIADGEIDGGLSASLVSDPVSIRVDNTAIELIKN